MDKKDLWQSDFFESKERFADAFNGILFKGRQLIKAKELEQVLENNSTDYSLDREAAKAILGMMGVKINFTSYYHPFLLQKRMRINAYSSRRSGM